MARTGRPRRDPGVAGTVNLQRTPSGWRARCTVRDPAGRLRYVTRVRASKAAAENAVRAAAAQVRPELVGVPGDDVLHAWSPLTAAVDLWVDERRAKGVREQSVAQYASVIKNHLRPRLGDLILERVTTARLDSTIKQVAAVANSRAVMLRQLLVGALDIAVRHGALQVNPAVATVKVTKPRKEVRALTAADTVALLAHLRGAADSSGLAVQRQVETLMHVLAGTGMRVGEGLALTGLALDLDDDPPTLEVLATVATGTLAGTVWQPITKTDASRRRLILPAFVVAAINRAQAIRLDGGERDLVFPNLSGGVRQPGAIRQELATMLVGTEWTWVHTHVMRKTVATLLARELDSEAAAEQLGHADDETTKRSYIEKMHATPDVRHVLDRLAG
jgi:integrase